MGPAPAIAAMILLGWAGAQPTPRSYVNIAYVPATGKVLVFGGQVRGTIPLPQDESIWWWDPADGSWSEAVIEGAPTSRSGASIAVHETSSTVLVYGGARVSEGGARVTPETWLFYPAESRWEQLEFEATARPLPGVGEALTYHPISDTFVLYGGLSLSNFEEIDQTWQFDLDTRTWAKVATQGSPQPRNFVALVSDPTSGLVVMYGSPDRIPDFHAYVFDPATGAWERRSAGPEGSRDDGYSRIVLDHDSGRLVRFGGTGEHADTPWVYDVATDSWQQLAIEGPAPEKRSRHGMTSVPGVGVVVFGGQLASSGLVTNELWVLEVDAGRWTQR